MAGGCPRGLYTVIFDSAAYDVPVNARAANKDVNANFRLSKYFLFKMDPPFIKPLKSVNEFKADIIT
jgi:hypothetical protein